MGLRDKFTEQSPVRHLVRYTYLGIDNTEEFSSVKEANDEAKKLKKNKDYKNVRVDITTKRK